MMLKTNYINIIFWKNVAKTKVIHQEKELGTLFMQYYRTYLASFALGEKKIQWKDAFFRLKNLNWQGGGGLNSDLSLDWKVFRSIPASSYFATLSHSAKLDFQVPNNKTLMYPAFFSTWDNEALPFLVYKQLVLH